MKEHSTGDLHAILHKYIRGNLKMPEKGWKFERIMA
jgi:hypothetical protein